MAMRGSRDSQGKLGDAARKHALEWCDALAGPLPDQDKLFARILRAGFRQRASSDYLDGVAFLGKYGAYRRDTRAAHWHACANAHAPDTVDHAHCLRLLQQKADLIDFKSAERKLLQARIPPPDNDKLADNHWKVYGAHVQRKRKRQAIAEAASRAQQAASAPAEGDVTRPASPFILPASS